MLFYKPDLEGAAQRRQMNRLLRALRHRDEEIRQEAMDILEELGNVSVVPQLLELSRNKKFSRGQKEIGLTLVRLGSLEAVPMVCGMDFYTYGPGSATLDLARLGVAAIIPLLRFIDDPSIDKKDNSIAISALRWICAAYPCEKELSAYLNQVDGVSYAIDFLPDSLCANALLPKQPQDNAFAQIEYDLSRKRPELFESFGKPHHVAALQVILQQTKDDETRCKTIDALRKIYRHAVNADVHGAVAALDGTVITKRQSERRQMHEDALYGNLNQRRHTDEVYMGHDDTPDAVLHFRQDCDFDFAIDGERNGKT